MNGGRARHRLASNSPRLPEVVQAIPQALEDRLEGPEDLFEVHGGLWLGSRRLPGLLLIRLLQVLPVHALELRGAPLVVLAPQIPLLFLSHLSGRIERPIAVQAR